MVHVKLYKAVKSVRKHKEGRKAPQHISDKEEYRKSLSFLITTFIFRIRFSLQPT